MAMVKILREALPSLIASLLVAFLLGAVGVVGDFVGSLRDREFAGLDAVKKSTYKCEVSSALKNVAPGCSISDRWSVGIHLGSILKP
jgi:hypothetical protein